MAVFSKSTLSESVNGRGILVAATATAGTLVHTGPTVTTSFDEIWLYAKNTSASAVKLTVEWGGVTSPNDLIEFSVPAESGLYLITPGLLIKGAATALLVRAFAATANVVTLHGYVNKIV